MATPVLPQDLANGDDADATQVMTNFNFLLALFLGASNFTAIPQLAAAPDPTLYNLYYDTVLGVYRLYNYSENAWRGVALF
jgi:hypothetical protein